MQATWWGNVRDWLRGQFWVVPGVSVLFVIALAQLLATIDQHVTLPTWARFPGSRASARSLLSSIAGAMITFTGLVFSITVLVLQLASQQFSPRVLRTFLRDTTSKFALGLFAATFTYALIVLRQIGVTVPGVSVTFAVVLVVASVAMFIVYIDHVANSIRISTIMARVAGETRREIDRRYGGEAEDGEAGDRRAAAEWRRRSPEDRIESTRPGVVEALAIPQAVEAARERDVTFVLQPAVGDFVPEGSVLLDVHGAALDDEERADLAELVTVSRERSVRQDVAFGVRQLVDIAERALSPALNDPTTAVGAIDHIHDLLRRVATRGFPSPVSRDEDGRVRLVMPVMTWEGMVGLAVDEIRMYGSHSIQVHRRLRAMLEDLLEVVPEGRRPPLERQLVALGRAVGQLGDDRGGDLAAEPDPQGVGA